MAFPDPLSVKNAAAAAQLFTRRNPVPNGTRYVHTASSPSLIVACEIRNQLVVPKGAEKYSRSVVTFSTTVVDSDDIPHIGSVSLSYRRPMGVDITDAYMNDLLAYQSDFLVAASGDYKTRFLRGET